MNLNVTVQKSVIQNYFAYCLSPNFLLKYLENIQCMANQSTMLWYLSRFPCLCGLHNSSKPHWNLLNTWLQRNLFQSVALVA